MESSPTGADCTYVQRILLRGGPLRLLLSALRHLSRPTALLPLLLHQPSDQTRPARLVARPHPRTVVAVEIFVERHMIAPVRVILKLLYPAEHRPPSVRIPHKDMH